jgi:pimeloyl-ACP methyl ester carboxylesterase
MRWWQGTLIGIGAFLTLVIMLVVGFVAESQISTQIKQADLADFYATPDPLVGEPGALLRTEPLDVELDGGSVWRMLYVSERPNGQPAVSGGLIFIPEIPATNRPVVAWAHGTLGQGDACAPSRSGNPLGDMTGWIEQMMAAGWVVTATDYVGLGTEGPNLYLVAEAEVHDVVNSVRAVRNFPQANAGDRYVVWGHSQGGHSSLWSGHLAPDIAPELVLLGVAAAAPAAELPLIMGAQWQGVVGWVIGPEVLRSWPQVYPQLQPEQIVSARGLALSDSIAEECITSAAIEGQFRTQQGQEYFASNPIDSADWARAADLQTPPPLPTQMPVFIGQSTTDAVVLGWPNGVLQERWCAAGSTLDMLWLAEVTHQDTAMVIGPTVVQWLADRFANVPARPDCAFPPPVTRP